MPFWSSQTLKQRIKEIIPGGSEDRVQQGAYELSLGPEVYLSGEKTKLTIDPNGFVHIEPGRIALLLTEESVHIPTDCIGFISLKSTVKFPGLVNVSGFHVDPGFRGRLLFTVYNAGTEACVYKHLDRMFLLWLADLDQEDCMPYDGKNQNQGTIGSDKVRQLKGKGSSPAQLHDELERVKKRLSVVTNVGLTVLVGIFLMSLQACPSRDFAGLFAGPRDQDSAAAPASQGTPDDPVTDGQGTSSSADQPTAPSP